MDIQSALAIVKAAGYRVTKEKRYKRKVNLCKPQSVDCCIGKHQWTEMCAIAAEQWAESERTGKPLPHDLGKRRVKYVDRT